MGYNPYPIRTLALLQRAALLVNYQVHVKFKWLNVELLKPSNNISYLDLCDLCNASMVNSVETAASFRQTA